MRSSKADYFCHLMVSYCFYKSGSYLDEDRLDEAQTEEHDEPPDEVQRHAEAANRRYAHHQEVPSAESGHETFKEKTQLYTSHIFYIKKAQYHTLLYLLYPFIPPIMFRSLLQRTRQASSSQVPGHQLT